MHKSRRQYYHSSHYCPAYPNEADTNYYKQKLLEMLGGLLSGVGLTLSIIALAAFI